MKIKKKLKRIFRPYNIIVTLCVCAIAISVYLLLKPEGETSIFAQTKETVANEEKSHTTTNEVKVVKSAGKEVNENEAKKLAVKQFKELKEKGVKEKELEIIEFQRANELYYYISSKENTVEIKKLDGSITKINSVPVK